MAEAVSYLRSAGHWSIALWLARYHFWPFWVFAIGNKILRAYFTYTLRLRLSDQDFKALTAKYCDFLTSQGTFQSQLVIQYNWCSGRVKEACLTHLASGRNQAAAESLHLAQVCHFPWYFWICSVVLRRILLQERGLAARLLPLLDKACLDNEESSEEQTRLVNCLKEAVTMEAARSKLQNETPKLGKVTK